ncbi:MAG: hypothetical protein EZS28_013662, partial [Streblomastix strix]
MYNVSEKMNETLGSIPYSQHWGPNMVAGISNGLEETWLTQQMNNNDNQTQQSSQSSQDVSADQIKIDIACSRTFLFTEDEEDELINRNEFADNSLFDTITRVRHAVFTSQLLLQEFPFYVNDETEKDMCDSQSESIISSNSSSSHLNVLNKKVTPNITTAMIIADTKELPYDGEQLDYTAIMKTIRGAKFVACDNLAGFTGNEVLHILSGKEITAKPNQNGEESRSDELLKVRDKIRSQNLTQRSFGIILNQNHHYRSSQLQLQSTTIRPFILIASGCISLIMNVSGSYLFQFPISFLDPPMAAMYVTVRQGNGVKYLSQQLSYGNEEGILKHLSPELQRSKDEQKQIHQKLKDASSMDKIFIGGGKQLLVIMNGKVQVHHMKDKCIKDIVLIPTSNQTLQKIDSKLKISEKANDDSLQSVKSEEQDSHHFHKFWKHLNTSAIFISTTCGYPVLLSFDMEQILDVEQQEDFVLSPGCIQQAIIIPPKFKVPSHHEEDRVLLAMGNGRTGSLHLVNLSNKLVPLTETTYLGNHSFVTSCHQFAGSTMRNIILIEAEIMNKQNLQSLNNIHQNSSDIPLGKDTKSNSQSIERLSNQNIQTKIISKMFIISKDQLSSHKKLDIGIRTEGKVVAFHEAQGAVVLISPREIIVIPTLKYLGQIKRKINNYKNIDTLNEKNEKITQKIEKKDIQKQTVINQDINQDLQNNNSQQNQSSSSISTASTISSSTSIGPAMSHIPSYSLTHAEARHKKGIVSQHNANLRMVLNAVQQNIEESNRLVWHSPPLLTKEQCLLCENGETNIGFTEEAQLEHGAIGDNIIVVSHKRIAYVLLWHPAIPQLLNKQWPNQSWAPITRLTATAMGNEGKKMAYLANIFKMPNQNKEKQDKEENKLENKTMQRNLAQEQIKLQKNIWMMPHVLTTIATIKGPSQITSITTSMICGRHFVVVCFEKSAEVQVYRLDTFENARAAIIERENMWNFANKNVCDGYGKFKYPFIKRPNMNTNTTATGQFIETDENKLNDYAHTCVLTTFGRHVRKLGNEENILPDEQMMDKHEEKFCGFVKRYSIDNNYENRQNFRDLNNDHYSQGQEQNNSSSYEMNSTKSSNDIKYHSLNQFHSSRKKKHNLQNAEYPVPWEKQRRCGQYKENDGAVIAIGGRFGQIAFTCIPLAALMLEQAPIDYSTSTESIQAIITGQTTQQTFHFPPLIQFLSMGRESIELIEDNQFIIARGERTQIIEFNAKYCQIVFRSITANDRLISIAPVYIDDDCESRQNKRRRRKRKQRKRQMHMKYIQYQRKKQKIKEAMQQKIELGVERNNTNFQQQLDQEEEKYQASIDSCAQYDEYDLKNETGTLLLPTLAWIGQTTQTLTYGTIDKRRQINRVVKELPSIPISIAYLPSLSAIAEFALTIRNAMKQMSAPKYDANGIPFSDLAADHYADKHTMFPRNYLPLKFIPDSSFINSLCYSPAVKEIRILDQEIIEQSMGKCANVIEEWKKDEKYENLNKTDDNPDLLNEDSKSYHTADHIYRRINHFNNEQLENIEQPTPTNSLIGRIDIRSTFTVVEKSPVTLQFDEERVINMDIILLKRIRVIGCVQSLIAEPSMLAILNGKAAFVFGLQVGDILNDNKEVDEKKKKHINSNDDFCSCSTPLYNQQQQIRTIYPYHYEVNEVRNAQDFFLGTCYSTISTNEEELIFSHYAQQSEISSHDPINILHISGCYLTLIAQGHAPSLLISMQILDMNNIAVVPDHEVLIYNLMSNSQNPHNWGLFKKLKLTQKKLEKEKRIVLKKYDLQELGYVDEENGKEKPKINQNDNQQSNNKLNRTTLLSFETHPTLSLILSVRIPTDDNVTFLLPSSIGLHTLYGGMHGQLMRRFSKLSSIMRQDSDEMSVFAAVTIDNASESREQIGKSEITKTITAQLSYAAIRRLQEHQRRLEEQLLKNNTNQQNYSETSYKNTSLTDISSKRRSMLLERETNALMMSTHALTPINAMQILPEIPSFVMLAKSGWCTRSVPMRYEQFPLRDLSLMTNFLLQMQLNFGHVWKEQRNMLIQDYNQFEEQNWRKYVKKEIKNELEEIGTISLIPPHPVMNYVQPLFPVKNGRFVNGDLIFGISSLPLTAEFLQARTMDPWQLRKCMALIAAEDDFRRRWRLSERDRIRKQLNLPPPPDADEAENILIDRKQMKERENFFKNANVAKQPINDTQHTQYLKELGENQFVEKGSNIIQKQSVFGDK